MDLIEFFFGATKEEPKPKTKKKEIKIKVEEKADQVIKENPRYKAKYNKADLSGLRRRSKTEEGETNAD